MRLILSALFVLGLVVATQAEAHAQAESQPHADAPGFYAFEGLTYSKLHGEITARAPAALQVQFGVGYQPQNSLWAYELMGRGGGTLDEGGDEAALLGWGVRAKRFVPLARHFNLYGRVGVTENFMSSWQGSDLAGFGLEYGAGAMASMRVRALGLLFWPAFFMDFGPKVTLSLWADLGGEVGNLHAGHESSSESYDYRSTSAGYGLTIGGHF
tara:strand:- start:46006 stop:46644 length:639 start_codon:yes stop_codon:yes gene_type:complete